MRSIPATIGQQFGNWIILQDLGIRILGESFDKRQKAFKPNYIHYVLAKCKCGNKKEITLNTLKTGQSTQCINCGNQKRVLIHGKYQTPEYRVWLRMKQRCYNPNRIGYKNWGGRGIIVCDRWLHSFPNFLTDMGERPSKKHSIDRINNNGNYEPSNCRWATKTQQANNQRRYFKNKIN